MQDEGLADFGRYFFETQLGMVLFRFRAFRRHSRNGESLN